MCKIATGNQPLALQTKWLVSQRPNNQQTSTSRLSVHPAQWRWKERGTLFVGNFFFWKPFLLQRKFFFLRETPPTKRRTGREVFGSHLGLRFPPAGAQRPRADPGLAGLVPTSEGSLACPRKTRRNEVNEVGAFWQNTATCALL